MQLSLLNYSSRRQGPLTLLLAVTFLLLLFSVPLLYVFMRAAEAGWDESLELLLRPRVYELIYKTLSLDVLVTIASVLIGLCTAWCVERTDLPWRKAWNVLLTLPFAVPAFVSGYSWISVAPEIEGFGGAALVLTLSYYPLVHLPVAAALRKMDPALEETSRSLGYNRWHTFLRVTLPHLRPALAGGGILVALHILAEFGALAFLNYDTLTVAIFDQYEVAFNSAMAAILTFVLLLLCFFALVLEFMFRGSFSYQHARKSVSAKLEQIPLGRFKPVLLLSFTVLLVLAIGVPLGALIYWLLTGSSMTLNAAVIITALYSTVSYGVGGALVAILFALPLVILATRYKGLFAVLSDKLPYFIHSLPGLVIGLGLVFFSIRYLNFLYQTSLLLLLAYALLYLPLAQSSIRGVLVLVPRQIEEIAQSLGKSQARVFLKIVLPLIWSGVGAGFALVCMKVMTELTATLILRPIGVETLATKIWDHTNELEYAAAAPYALLLILISGLPVYLMTMRMLGKSK